MKYLRTYKKLECHNENEVFRYLIDNLKSSNTYWDYFVNWNKVFGNIENVELSLNILNYLIGKDDFEKEFKYIISKHPEVYNVIPVLLACRDRNFNILTRYTGEGLNYEEFNFQGSVPLDEDQIEKALNFIKGTGLSALFTEKKIKNVVDYATGVEVGLDSNGRKNRGGTTMENIVEVFIKKLCDENGYRYIHGGTSKTIKSNFGIDIPFDKSSRIYDFVIYNGAKAYLVETNFYGGGGSKLKATAGEYRALFAFLKEHEVPFIWITDGQGWKTTEKPLSETFNAIDYLLNLSMLENGALSEILKDDI
ncbi:MAG: type II restriction endonuclease [Candidatus Omnitrophica bacterium]|nr:type II restriction endonuclease [Candidatus Omnitrophota bacterium]